MTKEDIDQYFIRGEIPTSFKWEDGRYYYMWLNFNEEVKSYRNNFKWTHSGWDNQIYFETMEQPYLICFESEYDDIKQVLSDFLFWWEVNKHRCKEITYYKS